MKLTDKNVEAILKAPELREALLAALMRDGIGSDVLGKPVSRLDKDTLDCVYDAASEALHDCGLVVESYEAEQDKGAYGINIIGVPGAYYVEAPEYDEMGAFDTLEEARNALEGNYGEFLLP